MYAQHLEDSTFTWLFSNIFIIRYSSLRSLPFHPSHQLHPSSITSPYPSNISVNLYLFTHRLMQLSNTNREVPLCSGQWLMQKHTAGLTTDPKWLLRAQPHKGHLYPNPSPKAQRPFVEERVEKL